MRSSFVFCVVIVGAIALGVALFLVLVGGPPVGAGVRMHYAAQSSATRFEPAQPLGSAEKWEFDESDLEPAERRALPRSPFIDFGFAGSLAAEPATNKTKQPLVKAKPYAAPSLHTHARSGAAGAAPSPWDAFKDGNRYLTSNQYLKGRYPSQLGSGRYGSYSQKYGMRNNPYASRMSMAFGGASRHKYSSGW